MADRWHICDLCRYPGAAKDCRHKQVRRGEVYEICVDCSACRKRS